MPIYDFRCNKCGKVSEILARQTDNHDISCPECGSDNLERLISPSYLVKTGKSPSGATCCGRTERCDRPPCSSGRKCARD
ncbi:MAG: zinc ribbon domain-containing protein [Dehalococcoidia bacterium]|nr:MAG: zinc ribbon domain-containing protein [Dehalococcoidia bacterium]